MGNIMAYAQWVTITIYPANFNATIKNAAHSWGKFYTNGNKDDEIQPSAIDGTVIPAGGSYTISACGREDAASGTEGSFDVYDGDTKVGTYSGIARGAASRTPRPGPRSARPRRPTSTPRSNPARTSIPARSAMSRCNR